MAEYSELILAYKESEVDRAIIDCVNYLSEFDDLSKLRFKFSPKSLVMVEDTDENISMLVDTPLDDKGKPKERVDYTLMEVTIEQTKLKSV
ncbi:hypothetical protein SEA_KEELAN_129 [Gordonia phage Keelan]|nr:hypothetical protein SEA_KEELAN_129 [Gordonia phage Keelan]